MLDKREHMKIAAVVAYFSCERNMPQALACFEGEHPDHGLKAPAKFIQRWADRFLATGSVADQPHDVQHEISDEEAMMCADELVKHAYHTIEGACEQNEIIKGVIAEHGITWQHLLRRMHQVDDKLDKCVTFEVKMALKPEVKAERRATAQQLLTMWQLCGDSWLLRSCYVDSKTFVTTPTNFKGWGRRGQRPSAADIVIEDAKLDPHKQVKVTIYACVSPLVGLVHAKICSGTTGHHTTYMVRAAAASHLFAASHTAHWPPLHVAVLAVPPHQPLNAWL
jgi:hypothetical protein